jgi:hypothetical protein
LPGSIVLLETIEQNPNKEREMKKIEMAIKIASALFGIEVNENNWKVKDLMKRTKAELESHMRLADRITA